MKSGTTFVLGALAMLVAGNPNLALARNPNPGVMPINSYAFGKSYGAWAQEFADWTFQFSLADYPLFQLSGEVDCGYAQSGKVWFLYGALEDGVERFCTIPSGKSLLVSVNSVTSFAPEFGDTEDDLREDASKDLEGVRWLEMSIDGVPLKGLYSYRASSPEGGFVLHIQKDSILNELGLDDGVLPAVIRGFHARVLAEEVVLLGGGQ